MLNKLIRFFLENRIVVFLILAGIVLGGLMVSPFNTGIDSLPKYLLPVDAIPDIGENQQIVFTKWEGSSPEDVEDQITYPLTVSLMGIKDVKTIRSYSFFGFSSVYVVFKEKVDFYDARLKILEKLASIPESTLPDNVKPVLGPDATALGQIFWYTLEGQDEEGNPTGGWDLHELRSIQDWQVRYALSSAEGVSEVSSIGGFVKEYQIDVDPYALLAKGVTLSDVFKAVKMSNSDVGAKNIEINKVEYVLRGVGFIKNISDIENTVIKTINNIPVFVKDVATVQIGPAFRRGAIDKEGAETVGGVVVARYGENPLEVISNVKEKIKMIEKSLPGKKLEDGRMSQVAIVPFYDRTKLIKETLGTLTKAISEEILITIIVIVILLMHFASSLIISLLLPLSVMVCFMLMKIFNVDANIVALSGIAIAIGTMVDMGIIICENILRHLKENNTGKRKVEVIYEASAEVGSAVLTAVSTTIISFLPVFTMTAAEGKMFKPLAYTKSFALFASVGIALFLIPSFAYFFFCNKPLLKKGKRIFVYSCLFFFALYSFNLSFLVGFFALFFIVYKILEEYVDDKRKKYLQVMINYLIVAIVAFILAEHWMPLGIGKGVFLNFLFVVFIVGALLGSFNIFLKYYVNLLRWCLHNKLKFLLIPLSIVLVGGYVWAGLGREFMPSLDEGSYLYMPTTMPHASIGEALDILRIQDKAIQNIDEVESVVGKIGRADSALDPAPVSMIETVINYKSEYITDEKGNVLSFKYDDKSKKFIRNAEGKLVQDKRGKPFRQWRDHITHPDDIWREILTAAQVVGTTSAPKLQPIMARIVMLQSGMRAPMGVKIFGPDLKAIEHVGLEIERFLKHVPSVKADAVIADRVAGKPYMEIEVDREKAARYGLNIDNVQDVIATAIGGKAITETVEGRQRYPVRVRYSRELRDSIEALDKILVAGSGGVQIPLMQFAQIKYKRGPQVIKSEDTFLVSYVLFDKKEGYGEVDVVQQCQEYLDKKIKSKELVLPEGVSFVFAGNYLNQIRSARTLRVVLPLALFVIFLILYFQFKSALVTFIIFSGVIVAWAGGFIMIGLYSTDWFMNFSFFGTNIRDLFNIETVNLSVAVWVGFLALFGIATDDGVVIATYIQQSLSRSDISSADGIRTAIVEAASKRIRPCLMTSATTILALVPVLTSTGRGADIMVPMAIPSFGGMCVVLISVFVVPVLYSWFLEQGVNKKVEKL